MFIIILKYICLEIFIFFNKLKHLKCEYRKLIQICLITFNIFLKIIDN